MKSLLKFVRKTEVDAHPQTESPICVKFYNFRAKAFTSAHPNLLSKSCGAYKLPRYSK